jgi:hypothetical protein
MRRTIAILGAVAIVAAAASLAASAGGAPSRVGTDGVLIDQSYDAAGNPALIANVGNVGGTGRPRWSICSPPNPQVCRATGHNRGVDRSAFLNPGRSPAGTVFEATLKVGQKTYVARSGVWRGTVRAVSRPTLTGDPRVGSTVTPHAARWAGGWTGQPNPPEFGFEGKPPNEDEIVVEACRTATGGDCVNLSPSAESCGGGVSRAVVAKWFSGYLFAFDARFAVPILCALPGYRSPYDVPPIKAGQTVARSAPRGPVIGSPAPSESLLRDAVIRNGEVLVARIHCPTECTVSVMIAQAPEYPSATVRLIGTQLIGVPRGRLRPGRLHVRVQIGNGPAINGIVALR